MPVFVISTACSGSTKQEKQDRTKTKEEKKEEAQAQTTQKELGPDLSQVHENETRQERIDRHAGFFVHEFCNCFGGYQNREEIWEQPQEEKDRIKQCLEVVKLNMAYTLLDMNEQEREDFRQLFLDLLHHCECSEVIEGLH